MSNDQNQLKTIILYDGWCSICRETAKKLRSYDRDSNRLTLIDFRTDNTHVIAHNLEPAQIRRVLHAITPDGEILKAMDALRHTMRVLNRGSRLTWTGLPIIRPIFDWLYLLLADNRHRFPGSTYGCEDDSCSIQGPDQESNNE